MQTLLKRLNSEFDESEGSIRIVDAAWIADDLRLTVELQFFEESQPELWKLSCEGVVEELICSEYAENLSILPDSPLLKIYHEPEVDLFFSENQCDSAFLLGLVFSSCIEVLGRAEYTLQFINREATVSGITSSSFGLLGRFPESIAVRILDALSEHPIRINALQVGMPKRWTGTEFVNYPELKVLEIGSSYVIAESFSADRV